MVAPRIVIFDHLRTLLRDRDRGIITVVISPVRLTVAVGSFQFLAIFFEETTVSLIVDLPQALFEGVQPLAAKRKQRLRQKSKMPSWYGGSSNDYVILYGRNFCDDHRLTIDLYEPNSLEKLEYCVQNIITRVRKQLRRSPDDTYRLVNLRGANLIELALRDYATYVSNLRSTNGKNKI